MKESNKLGDESLAKICGGKTNPNPISGGGKNNHPRFSGTVIAHTPPDCDFTIELENGKTITASSTDPTDNGVSLVGTSVEVELRSLRYYML